MPTVAPCQFSPGDMANRDAAMEVAAEGIAKLFHARAAIDAGIGAVREWDEEAASHLSEVSAPMDHALSNACATALGDHALAVHTMRAMCRMPNIDINETGASLRPRQVLGSMVAQHAPLQVPWNLAALPIITTMDSVVRLAVRDGDREPLAAILAAAPTSNEVGDARAEAGVNDLLSHQHICSFAAGEHGAHLLGAFGPYEAGVFTRSGPVPPDIAWRICVAVCTHAPQHTLSTLPDEDASGGGWWSLLNNALSVQQGADEEKALLLTPLTIWAAGGCLRAQAALEHGQLLG